MDFWGGGVGPLIVPIAGWLAWYSWNHPKSYVAFVDKINSAYVVVSALLLSYNAGVIAAAWSIQRADSESPLAATALAAKFPENWLIGILIVFAFVWMLRGTHWLLPKDSADKAE